MRTNANGKFALPAAATEFFIRPLPVAAVLVLFANDQFFKWWFANSLTGKLSDFAGLFFFPLFALSLIFLFGHLLLQKDWRLTPRRLALAIFLTHLAFALIKLWPEATDFYVSLHRSLGVDSRVVRDPTDLWALAMAPLTYLYALRFTAPSEKSSI